MRNAQLSKWPLISVLILVTVAITLIFFFRMYRGDLKTLRNFMSAYESFDTAVSSYMNNGSADALGKAAGAAIDLQAGTSLRISSLIRNDAELMSRMREVAGLSRQELDRLRALAAMFKSGNPAPNEAAAAAELGKECGALHERRKAAYARFCELGGQGGPPPGFQDPRKMLK